MYFVTFINLYSAVDLTLGCSAYLQYIALWFGGALRSLRSVRIGRNRSVCIVVQETIYGHIFLNDA